MAKMTSKQRSLLSLCEEIGGGLYANRQTSSVAQALVRRGYFRRHRGGTYFVTSAGREALAPQDGETGR